MSRDSRCWLSVLLIGGIAAGAWTTELSAQATGRVQGVVRAAGTQRPLPGAQVFIPGTGIGMLTNQDGRYALTNVPAGTHTVRVQLLGYSTADQSVTVPGGQNATADFSLTETAVALDEIVVTGTAAQARKKELGNSIETISARSIEAAPVTTTQDVLAGRAASVTVMANSGQPGAGSTVKIRGINTLSQESDPLIYVDGIRIFNEGTRAGWGGRTMTSPLQDIAADDIERIEIVKGAAATTLYGTEASSGVIQIFTKKGSAGRPIWTAELNAGMSKILRWGTDADPTEQYMNCGNTDLLYGLVLTGSTRGTRRYFEDPTCPADGDWTQTGASQGYNVSVRGGNERLTYYVSGSYNDVDGTLPTMNSRDGGFRGNFSFAPTDQLSFSFSNAYTRRHTRWAGDGNNAEGFLLNIGRGPFNYMKGGKEDDCANVPAEKVCTTNAYIFDGQFFTRTDHFTTGLTTQYQPTPNFTNRLTVGWDYTDINNETTLPFGYLTLPQGYYWDENTWHQKLSFDYTGSLRNQFGEQLASTFSWGGQLFRDRHRWIEIDVESFAGPGEPTLESGAEVTYRRDRPFAETNAGFFLQEQLGWKDRLFLIGGMRVDGNSAFGDDFGLQMYPKISASYVISDHDFWPSNWFQTLKLRGALGESGKAPGAFDKLRTWQPISADEGTPGFTPLDIGNPNIGPERTRELEVGFDASMFDGRLGVELTGFNARTFDALVPVDYAPSNGFTAARTENVGELRNTGLELNLTAAVLRTNQLEWRLRFTGSWLGSEALDLDNGKPDTTSIYTGLNSEIREGYEFPLYFGRRIMNPNEFADPVIVSDTAIGRVYPNRLFGFGTSIKFSRFLLDALAEFQGGHLVQNYTGYQTARRGGWYPCFETQEKIIAAASGDAAALNDVKAIDRARCAITGHSINYWTEKGDFVKLRHVSLTYDIPSDLIRFAQRASITLAGRNLKTWTDYTGADPEVMDASDQFNLVGNAGSLGRRDYYQIPPAASYLLTFRVNF